MTKRASVNQLGGDNGEDEFAAWISRAGLAANKIKDYGIDFVCCQVPSREKIGFSYNMHGNIFLVSVRSTQQSKNHVRLNRADAELLLRANCPMALGMVKRGGGKHPPSVAMRPLDGKFIEELANFLGKSQKSLTVNYKTGIEDPNEAVSKIRSQFNPVTWQKIHLLRERLQLANLITKPIINFNVTESGVLALVSELVPSV
ncbi:hypothetical protein JXA32_12040 [Candidatus Sumerlaeota bacterium]|nr:hypothetical protein [Candidatus Sumerlaeota bacterium]